MNTPRVLDQKAREIGYNSYDDYLKNDFYWHAFCQFQLSATCFACKAWNKFGTVLHHINYIRLGHEWPEDVVTLCKWCHEKAHQMIRDNQATLANAHLILRERYLDANIQLTLKFDDRCHQSEEEAA